MSGRLVVVLLTASDLEPDLAAALAEDVVDLVHDMQQVEVAIACTRQLRPTADALRWPDMPVVDIEDGAEPVATALMAAHGLGAEAAAVVAADAPDLPPLLLGKLFSALTGSPAAACPAADGRLVALASRLPAADWLTAGAPSLDGAAALARLRSAAPARAVHIGAGWHRIRTAGDLDRLDPGLEGWDATRAYLSSTGRRPER